MVSDGEWTSVVSCGDSSSDSADDRTDSVAAGIGGKYKAAVYAGKSG